MEEQKRDFGGLYEAYYSRVYAYIFKRIRSVRDTEDLTQDVFVSAFRNFSRFDPQKSSFSTWVYIIAGNRLKNYYRDRRLHFPLDEAFDNLPGEPDDLARSACITELRERLLHAIQTLPERNGNIVILRYFHHMSAVEIARVTGLTAGNVRTILARSLKIVGSLLSDLQQK